MHFILAMAPQQAEMRGELSGAALAFAAAVTLGTVLLFGIAPALRAARTDPGAVMKSASRQSAGRRGDARFRSALSVVQIAFSTVLLVLAGLFTHSLANVGRVDLGMNVESLVTFTVSPRLNGYSPERVMALYDDLESRFAAQPGVTGVASASVAVLANSNWNSQVVIQGEERRRGPDGVAAMNEVSVDFFRTLGVPLTAGRTFTAADDLGAPPVAVVNEAFVRQFGLGTDVVGRRFGYREEESDRFEIAGLVADAKYSSVKNDTPAQFFLPRRQNDNLGTLSFYVRGALDEDVLLAMVPRVVAEVDPQLPVTQLVTMERQVEESVYFDRLVTLLSAGFVVLGAGYLPARRASAVAPMEALRYEYRRVSSKASGAAPEPRRRALPGRRRGTCPARLRSAGSRGR